MTSDDNCLLLSGDVASVSIQPPTMNLLRASKPRWKRSQNEPGPWRRASELPSNREPHHPLFHFCDAHIPLAQQLDQLFLPWLAEDEAVDSETAFELFEALVFA